jgi:hypothetical protein
MKVKELINILSQYPEDMEVWVSDRGYCEGGEKLTTVEKLLAYDASLDGDEINDEYIYVKGEDIDIQEHLAKGYILTDDGSVLSKHIIYLNDN